MSYSVSVSMYWLLVVCVCMVVVAGTWPVLSQPCTSVWMALHKREVENSLALAVTLCRPMHQALGALLCHGEANPITFVFVTYPLYYMYGCCVTLCMGKWFPFVHQFENCNPRSQSIIEGKERGKMWGYNWKRQFNAKVIYTYVSHCRKILSQAIMNENYHENG